MRSFQQKVIRGQATCADKCHYVSDAATRSHLIEIMSAGRTTRGLVGIEVCGRAHMLHSCRRCHEERQFEPTARTDLEWHQRQEFARQEIGEKVNRLECRYQQRD